MNFKVRRDYFSEAPMPYTQEIGHRLTLIGFDLTFLWLGFAENQSLTYQVLHGLGPQTANWFLCALLLVVCAAILDLVINDILPSNINIDVARRVRAQIHMFAAIFHVSFLAAVMKDLGAAWSPIYMVNFLLAFGHSWVAVVDTYTKFKQHRRRWLDSEGSVHEPSL